jgi:hypothetical protein
MRNRWEKKKKWMKNLLFQYLITIFWIFWIFQKKICFLILSFYFPWKLIMNKAKRWKWNGFKFIPLAYLILKNNSRGSFLEIKRNGWWNWYLTFFYIVFIWNYNLLENKTKTKSSSSIPPSAIQSLLRINWKML